jgi:putative transposase
MMYVRFPLSLRQVEDLFHERAMMKFRSMKSLQKFVAVHASVHNHFNQQRHLYSRKNFKLNRSTALAEWRQLAA